MALRDAGYRRLPNVSEYNTRVGAALWGTGRWYDYSAVSARIG